jgi:hypothetical protein
VPRSPLAAQLPTTIPPYQYHISPSTVIASHQRHSPRNGESHSGLFRHQNPKGNDSGRFNDLLSTLPKLTIPTPLQPLEKFALFPKLLIEIRIKIWKLLSTQPRKVKLFFDKPSAIREKSRLIEGQSKIPVVLQICQESRAEGLRFYTMCKEKVTGEAGGISEWVNYVYVNFDVDHFSHDITYLASGLCLSFSPLRKIKFIDANYYVPSGGRNEVEFDYVVLTNLLVGIKSLVDFRFVITFNNCKQNSFDGRPPR